MILSAILVSALVAAAPAEASTPTPAVEDEEVWALARKVNTPSAYDLYLDRFPNGRHRDEAVEAFYTLQGRPVLYAPPAAPPTVARRPVTSSPLSAQSEACIELQVDQTTGKRDTDEGRAYEEASRTNKVEDYRLFLNKFPDGLCSTLVQTRLRAREKRKSWLVPIPGFGPLAPHRRTNLNMTEDDYPVAALRNNESGTVIAEWVVSNDGVVESCRAAISSGSSALDERTCRIITLRLSYDPARDASGTPVASSDRLTVTWIIPVESAPTNTQPQGSND